MTTENQNSNAGFSFEQLMGAFAVAETRYLATNPQDKSGNPLTASADIRKARKFLNVENVAHAASMIEKAGIDSTAFLGTVGNVLSVKANMRMSEFFAAIHAKNYQQLDAVTVLSILSNAYAGVKTRDGLAFVTTGKGDESTSDNVKNIALVRKLQSVIKKVGPTTAPTQLSRSFGKGGFCNALGIGTIKRDEKTGARELVEVNQKNPFFVTVRNLIETASENTLQMMKGAKGKDAK